MKSLTIGNVVDFKNRSKNSQITLLKKLNNPKDPEEKQESGHYWISALSAIKNALKMDDALLIQEKINVLEDKLESEEKHINKIRWQKNIDMLNRFENYDFSKFQPKVSFSVLKGLDQKLPLLIQGLSVKLSPDYVVSFEEGGIKKIGAAMFVGRTKKFNRDDLAIFNDALYRYLCKNKPDSYEVSKELCGVIDVITMKSIRYSDIANTNGTLLLEDTLKEIKKLS